MSSSGKFTSLGLNVLNGLMNNRGFRINPKLVQLCGLWTENSNIQGSLVNDTVLNKITYAKQQALENIVPDKLDVLTWRKLLDIGKNICPALSNTHSDKFIPKYPGFGTWENKTIDEYGNVSASSDGQLNLTENIYPPKNYGKEATYSYIYNQYNDYAWVSGWPGKSSWQQTSDDFIAIVKPSNEETQITDYDRYLSQGFVSLVSRQAYYEFWSSYDGRRPNQYKEFIKYILNTHQWMKNTNSTISSFANTKSFIKGNYSNINDLTTGDIAGVNLAFNTFGKELIALGKSLDLSQIHVFGLPSKFLLNLQNFNALTDSLKMALILSDCDTIELEEILSSTYIPSTTQEKKIFNAMNIIQGQDLEEIKIILNCATVGLESLADLINPKKMFPTSYRSLTVPEYNIHTVSFKTYDLIYNGDSVNPLIQNYGEYLQDILPDHLALACGAFMVSINQIKNIKQMEIEKLAQVIINLESTNKDLPLINSIYGTPGDIPSANESLSMISFGSGNNNIYKFIDFAGAISGIPYNDVIDKLKIKISLLPTQNLDIIYQKILQKSIGNDWDLLGIDHILYKNEVSIEPNSNIIYTVDTISEVLSIGDIIIFDSNGLLQSAQNHDTYEVINVDNNTVTLDKPIINGLPYGYFIYKQNAEYNNTFEQLIIKANIIISNYKTSYGNIINEINGLWDRINLQISREQFAITMALQLSMDIPNSTSVTDIENFIRNLEEYAKETQYGEISQVLENISDMNNIAGQSLIGALREARNATRLLNAGGELDNDIDDSLNPNTASARAIVENGKIVNVIITSSGYGYTSSPNVIVEPQGGIFGGRGFGGELYALLDDAGSVLEIKISEPGDDYDDNNPPQIIIEDPSIEPRLGGPLVPGSFSGSPYIDQDPIPDPLLTKTNGSFTVDEAIDEIIRCKCDC